jgi:hypothetical protein
MTDADLFAASEVVAGIIFNWLDVQSKSSKYPRSACLCQS